MAKLLTPLVAACAGLGSIAALNPDPNAVVPYSAEPPVTAADLRVEPARWDRAAKLRVFTLDNSNGNRQIPDAVTLSLLHDGTRLYALWQCRSGAAPLHAALRPPTGDLTLDESVQLLLGLSGGPTVRLDMGGYANAQGVELDKVEHFYEFTVNRAGATSRAYNETLLPKPGFQAKVFSQPDSYAVIMVIPFAAAGIDPQANPKLHFNAFRFHHGRRYGWFLPAFGGYAAMPFGSAFMAPQDSVLAPTDEGLTAGMGDSAATAAAAADQADTASVSLDYYPLQRRVSAVFPADGAKRQAVVRVDALHLQKAVDVDDLQPVAVNLELPAIPGGQTLLATAGYREQGLEVPAAELSFCTLDPPDWYATSAGSEYTSTRTPRPWTQPRWVDGTVALDHADLRFGRGMLPETIVVRGRPLLAAPIAIHARLSPGAPATRVSPPIGTAAGEGNRIALRSSTGGAAEMRTLVDFDGFTVVRLRFPEIDARQIDGLTVEIPVASGVARYLARESVQSAIRLDGYDYHANGGNVWVGNESVGVAFERDKECFFSPPDGGQLEILNRPDGTALLRLHLVTAVGQVPREHQVFQFYLIPTPTRRLPPKPQANRMQLWFEQWSDYQGYPDLRKLPEAKDRAAQAHAKGDRLFMYSSQCLAENSPGAELYSKEWFAPPDRPWYKRAYEPGLGVPCHVSCFRGAAGDLLLYGYERLVREAGLDGCYMDGPSYPFDCANPSHACSDLIMAEFDDEARSGRIIGQRQFLKRMRGIFDSAGKENSLWAHTGGGLDIATLSLCDYFFEGEQLQRYRPGYLIDPAVFVVGYSGKPFGFRTIFLPVTYADASGSRRAMAWGLVHDVEAVFEVPERSQTQDEFLKLSRDEPGTVFRPYYQDQPELVRLSDDAALVSYYKSERAMNLVAANLRYDGTQQVALDLTPAFATGRLRVTDVGLRTATVLADGKLSFDVPEGGFRLFEIGVADAAEPLGVRALVTPVAGTPTLATMNGFVPEQWEVINPGEAPADNPEPQLPLPLAVVSGPPGGPEAVIRANGTLPATFTFTFRLLHQDCFRLQLGGFRLGFNSWSGWDVAGVHDSDPQGVCSAWTRWLNGGFYSVMNRPVEVTMAVHDGRITLLYDGRYMLEDFLLSQPALAYDLSLATWGQKWVMLEPESLAPEFRLPPERGVTHPVR